MSRLSDRAVARARRLLPVPPRVVGAIVMRPRLWATALRQARVLAAPGSVRPTSDYLAFRMTTQYGDPGHEPEPADVVSYLCWCRQWRVIAGSGSAARPGR